MHYTASAGGTRAVRGIFICYRRDDSQGEAGRIDDRLRPRYGTSQVFRDIHDSPPGVSFPEHLRRQVSGSRVVLVVIGPQWLESLGIRRDRADDWVRIEVLTALADPDRTVIPLLVRGAAMPRAEQLPVDLRRMATITAHELSDGRWDYDMDRLVEVLDRLVPPASGLLPARVAGDRKVLALTCGPLSVVVVFALLAGVVVVLPHRDGGLGSTGAPPPSVEPAVTPTRSPQALLEITPTSGPAGTSVLVTGRGYEPRATVNLYVGGTPVGSVTPDGGGAFSAVVTVPAGAGPGGKVVVAADQPDSSRSADALFAVT